MLWVQYNTAENHDLVHFQCVQKADISLKLGRILSCICSSTQCGLSLWFTEYLFAQTTANTAAPCEREVLSQRDSVAEQEQCPLPLLSTKRENHITHLSRGKKKKQVQNLKYITVSTKSALFWYQLTDKKKLQLDHRMLGNIVHISRYMY